MDALTGREPCHHGTASRISRRQRVHSTRFLGASLDVVVHPPAFLGISTAQPVHPPAFLGISPTRSVHSSAFLGVIQPNRYTCRRFSASYSPTGTPATIPRRRSKPQPIPALSYAPMNDGMRPAAVASAISRSAWATDSSSAGPMCQRAHSLTAGTAFATATECG